MGCFCCLFSLTALTISPEDLTQAAQQQQQAAAAAQQTATQATSDAAYVPVAEPVDISTKATEIQID